MSKLRMIGGENGTGSISIIAPDTNEDRTINLPDNNGDIITNSGNANLPTSDPAVVGALWNDNGTVKVSSG